MDVFFFGMYGFVEKEGFVANGRVAKAVLDSLHSLVNENIMLIHDTDLYSSTNKPTLPEKQNLGLHVSSFLCFLFRPFFIHPRGGSLVPSRRGCPGYRDAGTGTGCGFFLPSRARLLSLCFSPSLSPSCSLSLSCSLSPSLSCSLPWFLSQLCFVVPLLICSLWP
jgi:hypothetical protein